MHLLLAKAGRKLPIGLFYFGRALRGVVHAVRVRPGMWKTDTRLGVVCLPQAMPTGLHPSVDGHAAHKCAQPLSTTQAWPHLF